jgi:glycine cleavage system aminomethyltransferase T
VNFLYLILNRQELYIIIILFPGKGYYLAVGGAAAQQNYCHLMTVIQDNKFNCHLIDHTDDMVLISVQGPKRYMSTSHSTPHTCWAYAMKV